MSDVIFPKAEASHEIEVKDISPELIHTLAKGRSQEKVAQILVIGPDAALIEGIVQTLATTGHKVTVAATIGGAISALDGDRPMIALVARSELFSDGTTFRIPLAQGGALIAFHGDDSDRIPLPFPIQRTMLAALQLPLERQRLVALIGNVEVRARAAGRVESTEVDDSRGMEASPG